MRILILFYTLLFLFLNSKVTSQILKWKMVFDEQFEDNRNNWDVNTTENSKASIVNGKFIDELTQNNYQSLNLIDVKFNTNRNYTLKFSIANLNYDFKNKKKNLFPTYGFVWSFTDWNNYNYIKFQQGYNSNGKSTKLVTYYQIGSFVAGNEVIYKNIKTSFFDLNTEELFKDITIYKIENKMRLYVGKITSETTSSQFITEFPTEKWYSTKCGIILENECKIILDYLTIEEEIIEYAEIDTNKVIKIKTSSGSGFFVSKDGYVVTNYHVIKDGKKIKVDVNLNGVKNTYNAKIINVDKQNDLAILKINDDKFKNMATLPYNIKTKNVRVGEKVITMGYPSIEYQGNEVKITEGIISSNTGFQDDPTAYQISAPVQPGNSGGPLFDMNGNLIGITNSGILSSQNVGYSIKASYLMNFFETITAIPKLEPKSTLIGKSLPDIIDSLKPYIVLIRVDEETEIFENANKLKEHKIEGGYYANKLKDLNWNFQKNEWEVVNEFNLRSELYLDENNIAFKRGSNDWLSNKWTFIEFDSLENSFKYYDDRGQEIYIEKNYKFMKFYFNRDPTTDKFINCAIYEGLIKDININPYQ